MLDGQGATQRRHGFEQGGAGFLVQPGIAEDAGHLELAGGKLAVGGELLQFGGGERRRRGFGGFGRPEGAAGASGLGEQAGVNEPLQRLVGRAVNHFQAHGGQRVPLARAEVFLVQGVELLAVLRGVALDHDVKHRMRARRSGSAPRSGARRR